MPPTQEKGSMRKQKEEVVDSELDENRQPQMQPETKKQVRFKVKKPLLKRRKKQERLMDEAQSEEAQGEDTQSKRPTLPRNELGQPNALVVDESPDDILLGRPDVREARKESIAGAAQGQPQSALDVPKLRQSSIAAFYPTGKRDSGAKGQEQDQSFSGDGSTSPEKLQKRYQSLDEGKVQVRRIEGHPSTGQPEQARNQPGSLGEAAAEALADDNHPRCNQRIGNRTAGIRDALTEEERANFEHLLQHKPKQSIKASEKQRQKDEEMPVDVPWENTNYLNFLPRALGVCVSPSDGRVPTSQAPDLPHEPMPLVRPPFQAPVGYTTGERGSYTTRKDKLGNQQQIDRRGLTAYIRMTSRGCGYEFCDANGQHMSPDHIYFDSDKQGLSQHLAIARKLNEDWQKWKVKYDAWATEMREWRIQRRAAELDFWRHEVEAGNWNMFNPFMINPENATAIFEGLQRWVQIENQKDHKGEIPNAHKGRPQRRTINVSYEEIMELERQYGPEAPVVDFDAATMSMAERLGIYNRTKPADKRGDRLWRLGARMTMKKRGEAIVEWEVGGQQGPRPYTAPTGVTYAELSDYYIRDDESFNDETVEQVRIIINERTGGKAIERERDPADEPDEATEPRAPQPKPARKTKAPRVRRSGRVAAKTKPKASHGKAKAASGKGDTDPGDESSSSEDDKENKDDGSAATDEPGDDADEDTHMTDADEDDGNKMEDAEQEAQATPKRKRLIKAAGSAKKRKTGSTKTGKNGKSGKVSAKAKAQARKDADKLGRAQRKETTDALKLVDQGAAQASAEQQRRPIRNLVSRKVSEEIEDIVAKKKAMEKATELPQQKPQVMVRRRQPSEDEDTQKFAPKPRQPATRKYESDMDVDPLGAADNLASNELFAVLPQMTDKEYLDGKFEMSERQDIMATLKEDAIAWIEEQGWDGEQLHDFHLAAKTDASVYRKHFSYEDAVKWAPVKLTRTIPRGKSDDEGWTIWFQLERSDCGRFMVKRMEAAFLQHPNDRVFAVKSDNYALRNEMTGKDDLESDFDEMLIAFNLWANRDNLAREGHDFYNDERLTTIIENFWADGPLLDAIKAATFTNIPEDVKMWLDKSSPRDANLYPGTNGLKKYKKPKTKTPPPPPRKEIPPMIDLSKTGDEGDAGDAKQNLPPVSKEADLRLKKIKLEQADEEWRTLVEDAYAKQTEVQEEDGDANQKETGDSKDDGGSGSSEDDEASNQLRKEDTTMREVTPEPKSKPVKKQNEQHRVKDSKSLISDDSFKTAGTEHQQSPVTAVSDMANKLGALTHNSPFSSPSRGRGSSTIRGSGTLQDFQQFMYGPPGGVNPRAVSRDPVAFGDSGHPVNISKEKPAFGSSNWYAHPQFELPADFPTCFGMVKVKELGQKQLDSLRVEHAGLEQVYVSSEGMEFYRMKDAVDTQGTNRQIMVPLYTDLQYRLYMVNVDLARRFHSGGTERWDEQGNEAVPVYDAHTGVRLQPAHWKELPARPTMVDLELAVFNDEAQCWESEQEQFYAVAPHLLGQPTVNVALIPIRQGFAVKTTLFTLPEREDLAFGFNAYDRYPWDRRRKLRLVPLDEDGEPLNPERIVKPKLVPLVQAGRVAGTPTGGRKTSGLQRSVEN